MLQTLITSAIEKAHLFELATTDSLTGLYLRRYFEVRLQEEMVRVRRYGRFLSLLMLDIDFFKRINDTYGHQQGDKVLQGLASILTTSIRRDIDLSCRYGGEEFILLLPDTEIDGAYVLAERIRKRCAQTYFQTLKGKPLSITVSIGIIEMSKTTDVSKDELLRRVDNTLYVAKQSGRNCTVKYEKNTSNHSLTY